MCAPSVKYCNGHSRTSHGMPSRTRRAAPRAALLFVASALPTVSALRLHSPPASDIIPTSRPSDRHRLWLLATPLLGAMPWLGAGLGPAPCSAAIPSMSEYASEQYKLKPPPPPPVFSAADYSPLDGLKLVRSGLVRATALIERGDLEAVRALLREPLFTAFLGFTPGVRGNAGNLKPSAALLAAGCDRAALDELLLSLKRLDDFCLANRVIIFNQEDLDQVNALMKSSGKDGSESGRIDYEEARMFLKDAAELLDEAMRGVKS